MERARNNMIEMRDRIADMVVGKDPAGHLVQPPALSNIIYLGGLRP